MKKIILTFACFWLNAIAIADTITLEACNQFSLMDGVKTSDLPLTWGQKTPFIDTNNAELERAVVFFSDGSSLEFSRPNETLEVPSNGVTINKIKFFIKYGSDDGNASNLNPSNQEKLVSGYIRSNAQAKYQAPLDIQKFITLQIDEGLDTNICNMGNYILNTNAASTNRYAITHNAPGGSSFNVLDKSGNYIVRVSATFLRKYS